MLVLVDHQVGLVNGVREYSTGELKWGECSPVQSSRDVAHMARTMAFRIETVARGRFTVFVLSGRIETPAIAELRRSFELQADYCNIVIDLKDVSLVGRDVLGFLVRCEADGVKLENCPSYIREWMEREKD
jgi:hypothetical protein